MILFLYLVVPFIGIIIRKFDNPTVLYLLFGWLILTVFCKSIPLNLYSWRGEFPNKFFAYFLFSGYLILGYFISKITISNMAKYFSSLFFILSIILSAVLTYVFSRSAHRLDLSMYGYLSLNTIVQTTALFMWVKNSTITNKVFSVIQHTISDYSYGIYLVHVIVIDILFSYGVFWTMAYPLISLPFLALLILIASFLIIFSLRKIPFGNYISG